MNLGALEIVYLITYILGVYVRYKLMHVFIGEKSRNRAIEIASYCSSYFFITLIYLTFKIPIISLIVNIGTLAILTLNYKSSIKKRILAVLYIVAIGVFSEIVIYTLMTYADFKIDIFSENKVSSILTYVFTYTTQYLISIIIGRYKNIKKSKYVSISSYIYIIIIPIISFVMVLSIIKKQGIKFEQVLMLALFVLVINFIMLYLYDSLSAYYIEKTEKVLLETQNRYYNNEYELMKTSLDNIRALKHDLTNHLSTVQLYIDKNERNEATQHISSMLDICSKQKDLYSDSGNLIIDSIINFKLKQVKEKEIKSVVDIQIPYDIKLESFDMTIILGNLIDNAIEAVCKLEKGKRYINIGISYERGQLFIEIANPYINKIVVKNDNIVTTKMDTNNHGIGLSSVKEVVEKYDGFIDFNYNGEVFSSNVVINISC